MSEKELKELKKRIEDIKNDLKYLSDEELQMVFGGNELVGIKHQLNSSAITSYYIHNCSLYNATYEKRLIE